MLDLDHKGSAVKAQLSAQLGGTTSDLTFNITDASGWPDGTGGLFFALINRTGTLPEKILCTSRTALVVSVWASGNSTGRAYDDTSIAIHAVGEYVEHTNTAYEANQVVAHVNATAKHWTIVTSATRPAAPVANQVILETDTLKIMAYISGSWQAITSASTSGYSKHFLLMGA